MGFSFTSLAECEYCGNPLSNSTEECDECDGVPDIEVVFKNLLTGDIESIIVSKIRTSDYLWEELARSVDDYTALEFGLLGTREQVDRFLDMSRYSRITDVPARQYITEYNGDEDLDEL